MRGEKTNAWTRPLHNIGSPPRARGEVHGLCNSEAVRRITPACAGRSLSPCSPRALGGDHPRVRGEKYSGFCFFRSLRGSPPRARGEVAVQRVYLDAPRITPACAGRRSIAPWRACVKTDHPRVRGEKHLRQRFFKRWLGSPPRARGEACRFCFQGRCRRDHPRVCGEKALRAAGKAERAGSPPRVRGEENRKRISTRNSGITPACAGRSLLALPPRDAYRITPACAGRSIIALTFSACSEDHPRVCGEKKPSRRSAEH